MTPSRFTGDDLICLSAAIAAELDSVRGRAPSMAEDFNRVMRTVPEVVGRRPIDLLESELEELASMVTDAIAGRRCPESTLQLGPCQCLPPVDGPHIEQCGDTLFPDADVCKLHHQYRSMAR